MSIGAADAVDRTKRLLGWTDDRWTSRLTEERANLMALALLRKRVRRLERELQAQSARKCTCRSGQETRYHNAAELARIAGIHCLVHEFRDLGEPIWVSQGLPLRQEDQGLCSCPTSAVRNFVQGTRGALSKEEQAEANRVWEMEFTEDAQERFRGDQMQVGRLLQQYEREKRRAHAHWKAMSQQDKRG